MSNNYVYFMRDINTKEIKIGQSYDPENRIKAVSSTEKRELILLRVVPAPSLEKLLHYKFHKDRIQGEWFHPSEELLLLLEKKNIAAEVMFPELIEEAKKTLKAFILKERTEGLMRIMSPYEEPEYFKYPIAPVARWNAYYKIAIWFVNLVIEIDSRLLFWV